MELPVQTIDDLLSRLRRVEGQVRDIQQMLAEGRECRDVVTQISAARKALDQAGFKLAASGLTYCLAHPEDAANDGYDLDAISELFSSVGERQASTARIRSDTIPSAWSSSMKDIRTLLMIGGLSAAAVLGQALPAAASHESSNHLTFAPVVGSSAPSASGRGGINYVKGASGDEPDTQWTSSFHFSGLTSGTTYTVGVKGRFADSAAFSGLCSFTANASGTGTCASRFTGLQRLAVAQLRVGGDTGAAVLQATRQAVLSGPGSIDSSGGCREPDQMGSTCAAPGRV